MFLGISLVGLPKVGTRMMGGVGDSKWTKRKGSEKATRETTKSKMRSFLFGDNVNSR